MILSGLRNKVSSLRLNRKIQITFISIIVPLFILFVILSASIYKANQKYDRVISNATEASRFSITFKEDFDYKVYRLVAYGETEEIVEDIYSEIALSRDITTNLIENTTIEDNRWRAQRIQKMLNNLEEYVERIRANKRAGGYYDENYTIWENDIQIVTSLIQSTMSEYTYFETKGMNEVRQGVYKELNRVIFISLIVFGCLILLALLISVVIPNSIVKPIYHLNDVTNQVAMGDLNVRAKPLQGQEVRQLGASLNVMIEEIDGLVEAIKLDERNLREAELELLQAQINPHFLYNTLDTIVWLAESGNQETVVSMVTTLSEFFRTSLGQGSDLVQFSEEIKHVASYLKIQQVRYQDILSYHIEIDEDFSNVKIPKITLQPIVENALYHGIKNCRQPGIIRITTEKSNDRVIIKVSDNGIGMSEEVLDRIRQSLSKHRKSQSDSDSYGLYNVNERIRLKFGEDYGISIHSKVKEGTIVSVCIPLQS